MKNDNKKQILKGVLLGSVSLEELKTALSGKAKCPSITIWQEVKPGYYQHPSTGEVRPESQASGGLNVLVKMFQANGTPVPKVATCESEVMLD
jgi:hypothetical protein